ncbi:MAG TPA: biopolymer transporter ExbD [Methylomirabilota bacterium]|jgi:biopolymer transport protein TolR|nr:biopolymer transporter ExbD [Methylomirabilota bacterium]
MAIKADAGAESAGATRGSLAEINVIPLVDVVLVLLLIFMLTAPMMYRGIDVNLPKSGGKPTAVEERMVLTITRDRLLYLNDRPLPLANLEARLRDVLRDRTDRTLYIKADKELAYGQVVETMDRVRRAGVERVGMITEPLARRE